MSASLTTPVSVPTKTERKLWHIDNPATISKTYCGIDYGNRPITNQRPDIPGQPDICIVCESLRWGCRL